MKPEIIQIGRVEKYIDEGGQLRLLFTDWHFDYSTCPEGEAENYTDEELVVIANKN